MIKISILPLNSSEMGDGISSLKFCIIGRKCSDRLQFMRGVASGLTTDRQTDRQTWSRQPTVRHHVALRLLRYFEVPDCDATVAVTAYELFALVVPADRTQRLNIAINHDLLHPPNSHHTVCSAITAHNLTPVKRDDWSAPRVCLSYDVRCRTHRRSQSWISTFHHGLECIMPRYTNILWTRDRDGTYASISQ